MKFTNIVNSFKTGKVSKKIQNRQDVEALKSACDKIDNFFVTPIGSLKRRPSTELLTTDNADLSADGNIYEFNYSSTKAFIVHLDRLFDIFTFSSRANLYSGIGTYGSAVDSLTKIRIFDMNGKEYKVQGLKNFSSSSPYATISAHTAFSVTGPWGNVNSARLQVSQFGRKLICVDTLGIKAPIVIDMLVSDGLISFAVYPFIYDWSLHSYKAPTEMDGGGYVALGGTTHNFPPLAQFPSPINVSNPNGAGTAGKVFPAYLPSIKYLSIHNDYIKGDMLGVGIKILNNTSTLEGIFTIVGPTGNTTATTTEYYAISSVELDGGAPANYVNYAFSRWGDIRGFPKCVSSYKDRVVFGAQPLSVNRFWISAINSNNTASFQNLMTAKLLQDASTNASELFFFGSALSDVALSGAFNDSETGEIRWIRGKRFLHFGTSTGEQQVSFLNGQIQIASIDSVRVSSYNSSEVQPVEGDKKIFYVSDLKSNIRALSTDDRTAESQDITLSVLSDGYNNITKIRWYEGASTLLMLHSGVGGSTLSDRKLSGVTVCEQSQTSAFYDFLFNNSFMTVDDFCVVKAQSGSDVYNQTYTEQIILKCKVVATSKIFLLKMRLRVDDIYAFNVNDPFNTHTDVTKVGLAPAGSNTVTNILWANQQVAVLCVGAIVNSTNELLSTEFVTADATGAVTFDAPDDTYAYIIGLPSPDADLITSPINFGSQVGQAVGLIKRIDRLTPFFTASGKAYVGTTNASIYLTEKVVGSFNDYYRVFEASNNPDYEVKCRIKSYGIEPLNISNIAFRGVTYEGE